MSPHVGLNRRSLALLVVLTFLIMPMAHVVARDAAVASDQPIRGESWNDVPQDVEVIDAGDFLIWSHVTPEHEINETEYVVYLLEVNERTLGAEAMIHLEIVDKFWSFEPDLDLYVYDPSGELVASSEQEGDADETLWIELNATGTWEIEVYDFEGDGYYQLYRDVYSNAAPIIDLNALNAETPFVFDPVLFDACMTYDLEGHDLTYQWFIDGVEHQRNLWDEGEDCELSLDPQSTDVIEVLLRVTDEYGLESEEIKTVRPQNPGWDTTVSGSTLTVEVNEFIDFTFINMGPSMDLPVRIEDEPVRLQVGLQYDVRVDAVYEAQAEIIADMEGENHSTLLTNVNFLNQSQDVMFKPSLLFEFEAAGTRYTLPLPMLSNEAQYAGQPSFQLENYSFDLYYWSDYVMLDTEDVEAMYEFIAYSEFTLAEIDLYPIIEWMIDNLATAMGQPWVDTATNIIEKLTDIALPLEFNVDVSTYGANFVQAKAQCDGCQHLPTLMNGPSDWGPYVDASSIAFSGAYSLDVALGALSYYFVEVTPHIDLSLEMFGARLWTGQIFEFETLENDYLSTSASMNSLHFEHIPDSDGDGVLDNEDAFPNDATQSTDRDGDGCGDNLAGTNGDAFPDDADECMDSDSDGVGDNGDAFPNDANESVDSDDDGVGDNGDAFPNNADESMDSDGDGVGDNGDVFPNNADESMDSDGDSVGDNGDAFPNDANESIDSDGDGVGDNGDAFPNNADESMDSDGDGVGDNSDAFPDDPNETKDTDNDGIGDNADVDEELTPCEEWAYWNPGMVNPDLPGEGCPHYEGDGSGESGDSATDDADSSDSAGFLPSASLGLTVATLLGCAIMLRREQD